MSLPAILRTLATSYRLLPDLLDTNTGASKDVTGIRAPKQPHSPAPINLDVSDLITDIGRAAAQWEWELCRAFWLPSPYWTKHRTVAVPLSLTWSARTIEDPPQVHDQPGQRWWQPAVPDELHSWITTVALELNERVSPLVWHGSQKAVRADEECPLCHHHTLMGVTESPVLRCVTAGCGYEHRMAA